MTTAPDKKPSDALVKKLFALGLERPESERAAFLARECEGDAALRQEIEALLAWHAQSERRFSEPTPLLAEEPGDRIGRYQLLQVIGEGAFGTVWMAEQEEPVRRKVALKILKPGLDTQQVIGRFEAERQALAIMDHPHIAKVFDGGATPTGRPYFVMELVRGVPLTRYCDEAMLSTKERLKLFVLICQAVQHAHQKGVIHRDLKPSNVLVTRHDSESVPKVIDFGIAKATGGMLTERTVFTEFHQMLGTPEYMAPEQAEMSGLDVDTRADVYSLGVLLYELLTGTRPFDLKTVVASGYAELLRTIREVDPPRPSTRASTLGDQLVSVARVRGLAPKALGRSLRGDLDAIVMKALEKGRARRYETASALADDVIRHLRHEPVLASLPSQIYRLKKYVRRHCLGVAASIAIGLSLAAGLVLAGLGYREATTQALLAHASQGRAQNERNAAVLARAEQERQKEAALQARANEQKHREVAEQKERESRTSGARAEKVVELLQSMLSSSDPHEVKGKDYTVRQLLDDFDRDLAGQLKDEPQVEADVRFTMAQSYLGLGLTAKAEPHVRRCLELRKGLFGEKSEAYADGLCLEARMIHDRGRYDEAATLIEQALALYRQCSKDSSRIANTLHVLVDYYRHVARFAEAEEYLREARGLYTQLGNADGVALAIGALATLRAARGDYRAAEDLARDTLARERQLHGEVHPFVAAAMSELASILRSRGKPGQAEQLCREGLALQQKLFGNEHPSVAQALTDLASVLSDRCDLTAAEPLCREALAMQRKLLGEEHPDNAHTLDELAVVLRKRGDLSGAEQLCREALALQHKLFGEEHPEIGGTLGELARILHARGDLSGAEQLCLEALTMQRKFLGNQHPDIARTLSNLAGVLLDRGDLAGVEQLCREGLAMQRKLLGEEHPDIPNTLGCLAEVLRRRGDLSGAEQLFREALTLERKQHPDGHPNVAVALNDLAVVLGDRGDLSGAEQFFREALIMERKQLVDGDPNVTATLGNLAGVLQARGDLAGAEELFREALAMRQKLLGNEHPDIARRLRELAVVLEARHDLTGAEALFRQALAMARKFPRDKHADLVNALSDLACFLENRGDLAATEQLHREALSILRQGPGDQRELLGSSLITFGIVQRKRGELAEAESLLREAVDVLGRLKDPGPDLARAKHWLGLVLVQRGEREEAATLVEEALELLRVIFGETHTEVAANRWTLGALLCDLGRADEAEPLVREAVALARAGALPPDCTLADALELLGRCLLLEEKAEEAEAVMREALKLRPFELTSSWSYYHARSLLGGALLQEGRLEEAEPLLLLAVAKMRPPPYQLHLLRDTVQRVIDLYEAKGDSNQAEAWRARLATFKDKVSTGGWGG